MAILFIDYENGNDNYGGTSFALLASGTDGRISSTTFSAATANFPNDGSLINQYISIFNGTIYAVYQITAWISSTSLTIAAIPSGGTALANQTVDRQYFIGGRWKTTGGSTAVRTLPGDTIRIMGSPAPTSLGINGTWTSGKLANTINISSSTNPASPNPISITTSSAHGYVTGDTVVITGHTTNTNANGTWNITVTGSTTFTLNGSTGNGTGGASGTVRLRNNTVVNLASSLTQNIASFGNVGNGRTAWTAATNVTTSLSTSDTKEGDSSDSIAVSAAFTTGKAAFKSTGSLNLSGYQQISFWIKQTAGTVTVAGDISLRLCTDTNGDTVAHTFNIEGLAVLNYWTPITIDLGSAMNSNIQSIALYVDTDRGAQTFLLSNIIACKASSSSDSLSLVSLLGKNTANETWWAIQSINGTRVMLDGVHNIAPFSANNRGYYGVSETVTTFKRETIKTPLASGAAGGGLTINEGGTSGNIISYQFGWDRTNMSTQSLETWFDGRNGNGIGISNSNWGFFSLNKCAFIRYYGGVSCNFNSATDVTLNVISCSFNNIFGSYILNNVVFGPNTNVICNIDYIVGNANGFQLTNFAVFVVLNNCKLYSNSGIGIYFNGSNTLIGNVCNNTINNSAIVNNTTGIYLELAHNNTVSNCNIDAQTSAGAHFYGAFNNTIKSCTFNLANNNNLLFTFGSNNNRIQNCTTSNAVSSSVNLQSGNNNYAYNLLINESNEFTTGTSAASFSNSRFYSHSHDNSSNNHLIVTDYGTIQSNISIRYSNSGISWALSPTSTFRSSSYPLDFAIAKIAVAANNLVTVRAWMRRSNIALTTGLRIKGGQISGVSNDITSYMTAAADTWEQVTLTFTPTEVGVVEILAECWGGTTHTAYVDDISITQV